MLCLVVGAGSIFVVAETDSSRLEQRRLRLEREIARLIEDRDQLVAREVGILGKLDRLAAEARLLDAQRERLRVLRDLAAEALTATREQVAAVRASLSTRRSRLAATARLLNRVGPSSRIRPVLAAADAEKLAGGLRLAHELTRREGIEVERIRSDLRKLEELQDVEESQEKALAERQEEIRASRMRLDRATAARRKLLSRIREQHSVRARALEELQRASDLIGEMITGQRAIGGLNLDIRHFRGLLSRPAGGRISQPFGDVRDSRFGTVLPHQGWDIDARFGAKVRSVFDGHVVWADWFRGYGLMVVVDHGGGVHSVYAHLSVITVSKGASVERDQAIGRVGDTGSLKGSYLYFEMRESGKAVDPASWLKPG